MSRTTTAVTGAAAAAVAAGAALSFLPPPNRPVEPPTISAIEDHEVLVENGQTADREALLRLLAGDVLAHRDGTRHIPDESNPIVSRFVTPTARVCVEYRYWDHELGRNRVAVRKVEAGESLTMDGAHTAHRSTVRVLDSCPARMADSHADHPETVLAGSLSCTRTVDGETETFTIESDRSPAGATCTCIGPDPCAQCTEGPVMLGADPCQAKIQEARGEVAPE